MMATSRHMPGGPSGPKIVLRGGKAVLVLLALTLAPPVYGRYTFNKAMGRLDEARSGLRMELLARATRETLPELEGLDFSKPEAAARTEAAARRMRVAIDDMQVRGAVFGGLVFRIVFSVDGKPPLGRDPVEYYRMDYSQTMGWMLHKIRRVHPVLWTLAPWRARSWTNEAGKAVGV